MQRRLLKWMLLFCDFERFVLRCRIQLTIRLCTFKQHLLPELPYVPGRFMLNGDEMYSVCDLPNHVYGTDVEGGMQMWAA